MNGFQKRAKELRFVLGSFLQKIRAYGAGCDSIAGGWVLKFYALRKRHSPEKIPRSVRASNPWTVAADVSRLKLRFMNFRWSLLT